MRSSVIALTIWALAATASADSLNCRLVGNWPFGPSHAVAVDSARSLAFCDSGGDACVLDVSNPAQPVRLSKASTWGLEWLCPAAGRLYIADGYAGFEVWDISTPLNPQRLSYSLTSGPALSVAVAGNYAYVAEHDSGLRVIDVSDPAHPEEVGCCTTPGEAQGVAVAGSYAYVADYDAGLRVVSISDPVHPREVGYYDTPGYAYGVVAVGTYAYVADEEAGLRVTSVSDPVHPQEVDYYDTPGYASRVAVAGNYVYVADLWSGLRVVNVNDPAHPQEAGYYDTRCYAYGVAVVGNYAYVAGDLGLQIIEFYGSGVQESPELQASNLKLEPTVVRGVLSLDVGIRQRAGGRTVLFDANGRRVLYLRPGPNDVSQLAPGVYFVAERATGSRQETGVRKVVVSH